MTLLRFLLSSPGLRLSMIFPCGVQGGIRLGLFDKAPPLLSFLPFSLSSTYLCNIPLLRYRFISFTYAA